jgi:glycoside/pentoside/hexuronide:cation symporter, GPH family
MADSTQRLSFVEKAGYSLGDAGANFVFMTMIIFQLNFYTDTMGIAAGTAGALLLVGRLWDAFFDPMMGVIADRTNTRWGKFRPWILWTALPWSAVMVLAYTVPNWSYTGLVVYACVTNTILMTLYSANNTPYSALTGVMTGDVNERTRLSSFRFVSAMLAQLLVGTFTLPLVKKLGGGDDALGWQLTMGLWAILCFFLFIGTFLTVRERIHPDPKQKSSIKADFGNLLKNLPWITMFILTLAHFIYVGMRGSAMNYMFKWYLDKDAMIEFLKFWGLASSGLAGGEGFWFNLLNYFGLVVNEDQTNVYAVSFSLYSLSIQIVQLIGVFASAYLSMRFGKKFIAVAGFALSGIFMASFIFMPSDTIWGVFLLDWTRALCYSPTIPLLWAMFADVVDYGEWQTHRRTTGVIYATIMFGLKAGLSLGGFFLGLILGLFGYVTPEKGEVVLSQSANAILGIRLCTSVVPTLFFIICIGCLFVYPITKKLNIQIQDELAERRKKFAIGETT